MKSGDDVWYIPQSVFLDDIKSILAYCYTCQKANKDITTVKIIKTISKSPFIVKNTVKLLENIKMLTTNNENDTYHLSDVSMKFAEKLKTGEDITKEANEIIEESYLSDILHIILDNNSITKESFIEKILINSSVGNPKRRHPYITTINCILDILNLTGTISEEKFLKLRDKQKKDTKSKTTSNVRSKSPKQKEKLNKEIFLGVGVYGIIKTNSAEIHIKTDDDLKFS
ncbi:MAG: hypothetical protein R1F52_03310 [Candidatus Nitrosoabyssus spongiisocia]|nr:MAG: hypothetical protein R1F52_03310 [Nitrosopumilaceae archaeon AB1(1)]